MVSFLPRQDMNNGAIRKADLFAKSAAGDWEKIASYSGTDSNRERQAISLPATVVRACSASAAPSASLARPTWK